MENSKNFENSKFFPLNQEEFNELINLRKKQISGNFTPEESAKIRELTKRLELYGKVGEKMENTPLSSAEYSEFLRLTKCQMNDVSPENPKEKWDVGAPYAERLRELYKRLEKYGKIN